MLLHSLLSRSPLIARVVPFVLFVLLTAGQGRFGPESAYWFYLAKIIVGAWLIWEMRSLVTEMRWAFSWEAAVVGVGIFFIWVGISHGWATQSALWAQLGFSKAPAEPLAPWNPNLAFGEGSALAWAFIVMRILGSTLVVPALEEVVYRSFLYRYIAKPDFMGVPLNQFLPGSFIITAAVFGFAHHEWLAGIICGAAYQWLVLRKNRLGDAMTAHAITNFLLGLYIVWRGEWRFW